MTDPRNPFGLHTVTPYLLVNDVRSVVAFAQAALGAEVRGDLRTREDGSVQHAEIVIGNSVVMLGEPLGDEAGEEIGTLPASLYVYVDDCEVAISRAVAAGGEIVLETATHDHGDRYGGVRDGSGNVWWITQHVGR